MRTCQTLLAIAYRNCKVSFCPHAAEGNVWSDRSWADCWEKPATLQTLAKLSPVCWDWQNGLNLHLLYLVAGKFVILLAVGQQLQSIYLTDMVMLTPNNPTMLSWLHLCNTLIWSIAAVSSSIPWLRLSWTATNLRSKTPRYTCNRKHLLQQNMLWRMTLTSAQHLHKLNGYKSMIMSPQWSAC